MRHAAPRPMIGQKVAPSETVSVTYRLVPLVPGHVLLPKVGLVTDREQVRAAIIVYPALTLFAPKGWSFSCLTAVGIC